MLDNRDRAITRVDRDSPLPLYYQVMQILLQQIESGQLAPGDTLPGEKELQELFGVSRITIRRALSELASEGYVSRHSGRGTFVQPPKLQDHSKRLGGLMEELTEQGYAVESTVLQYEVRPASPYVAQKLGVDEGVPVLHFGRMVRADGEPIAMATAFLNVDDDVHFTLEELNSESIFDLLENKYGIIPGRVDKTIEAAAALEEEAHLLDVAPNAPMLLTRLVVYDEQGRRLAYVKSVYRGDRYKYGITLTR